MSQRNRHTGHINAFKQRILDSAGESLKCSRGVRYKAGLPLKKRRVNAKFETEDFYITNTIVRVTRRALKEK